jgi:hypothetical protein
MEIEKSHQKFLTPVADDEGNIIAETPFEAVLLRAKEGNAVAMQIWAKMDKENKIAKYQEDLLNGRV